MKTICIENFGGPEQLIERELPVPKPNRNEVLVRIKAVAFNPVDVKMRSGFFPMDLPTILGGDFSGVIEGKGDLVRDFSIGEEVFGLALGQSSNGAYAEYVCLPEEFIAKKPQNLSFEETAAIPIAYLTAFWALIGSGAMQKERPLFIAGGSGGVGSAAISLAKAYQAGPVFTMAGSKESAAYLMERFSLPKEHILLYSGLALEQMAERLIEMNGGKRFYFTLDFVGDIAKDLCFALTDVRGHIATILPEDENYSIPIWDREGPMWNKSLSLHMVFLLAAAMSKEQTSWKVYKTQLTHLASLFEKNELIKPAIENLGQFSLETIQKAHMRLEEGHTRGKLVMTVSP